MTKSPSTPERSVASRSIPEPKLVEIPENIELHELGFTNISSKALKDKLGEPTESEDPDNDGCRFFYQVRVGLKYYEIHDVQDEDGKWDDAGVIEWHADCDVDSKFAMSSLRKAFDASPPYYELKDLKASKLTTGQLEAKGKRYKNPHFEVDDWRWMFKFQIGTKLYYVFDMADEDDEWDDEDDIEWFVRGNGSMKALNEYIMA